MSLRREPIGLALVLCLAVGLVVLAGSPSQADPKKLLVSNSASGPFADNLAAPLFEGEGPFVPLDDASSTFYVKNNSKQAARATLAVVNRGASGDFENALTFDVDIDGTTSTASLPSPGGSDCRLVTTGPNIRPGGVQEIGVSLAVADLDEQVGTDQMASLDFVVTLTQAGKRGLVDVCGAQAAAQPEVAGEQCRRDVVVTVAGQPSCVPTAVDAGATYGMGDPRSPAAILWLAATAMAIGACLVLFAGRRRRRRT